MTNTSIIALPYKKDLAPHYQNLIDLPGFVLLESLDTSRGRFDILSAYPYLSLTCDQDEKNISFFFQALKKQLVTTPTTIDLPFQGGAIGYFSYDLGAKLMGVTLPSQITLNDKNPLLAEVGFYDWAIIADHHLKKVSLISANQQPQTKAIVEEILTRWQTTTKNLSFHLNKPFNPVINTQAYAHSFATIKKALSEGRCYQVNLTQPFLADYSGNPWAIYKQIRAKNRVPYAVYLRGERQTILSFSPERLVKFDNGVAYSSPIKGTAPRSLNKKMDHILASELLNCEKNRAENTMIVDMIRNDLSKIAISKTVKVDAFCALESYRAVHHLVSYISAKPRINLDMIDIFLSCFPGASITGAPKLEAMKMIYELESYCRLNYCGSIGYFSQHGRFDTNIAIRTILAHENTLSLSTGGGIVMDSRCDEEYQECLTKIAAICQMLS